MYKFGDTVMLVKILDSEERGKLTGKVPLRTKGVVSYVFKDSVAIDGYIWYFDEIKLVVRGELYVNKQTAILCDIQSIVFWCLTILVL